MTEVIFPVYEKLQKMGEIRKTGPVSAFIHVYLKESSSGKEKAVLKNIAKALAKEEIVEKVFVVAGECDILLKVGAGNVFDLGRFVSERMREIKGIEKTVTMIVLDEIK
jgi:DNA-binding Lrp family transcriptional regulator